MNSSFINRLVGTSIVVIAAIVFIPNILDGEKVHYKEGFKAIPDSPEFKTIDLQESIDENMANAEPLKQDEIEDIQADDEAFEQQNAMDESDYAVENKVVEATIEPIAGNMGVVIPENNFLVELKKYLESKGALLIADEVMTGFRSKFGGAQELLGVEADITCLGKVIGGGFPVGAYGAREEIMQEVAPLGGMYQAGTLSGNPIAMAGGIATLTELKKQNTLEY